MTFMPGVLSSRRCRIGHFWRTIISLEPLKYTTSERHLSSIIIGEDGSCHVYNLGLIFHRRLRVPKYGAILEFLSFVVLMLTFCLCLARRLCYISLVYRMLMRFQNQIPGALVFGKGFSLYLHWRSSWTSMLRLVNMGGAVSTIYIYFTERS